MKLKGIGGACLVCFVFETRVDAFAAGCSDSKLTPNASANTFKQYLALRGTVGPRVFKLSSQEHMVIRDDNPVSGRGMVFLWAKS